jgi:cell division protein FtsL
MTSRRIKNSKKWVVMKFGLSLYLVIGLFALIGLRTAVVNLEYELGTLNKHKTSLIRKSKRLTAQRASFYSAKKVEDIATKKLGMSLPERRNVFFVRKAASAGPYKVSMDSNSGRKFKRRRVWK